MQTRLALGTLLALSFAFGCAKPLEVEEIPRSADPANQVAQLVLDLSAARSREIDLLSPSWFRRAVAASSEARERWEEGDDRSAVLGAVAEGAAALDAAERSAEIARTALAPAFEARERASRAGAARLGEPFETAESEFRELAGEIEANDLAAARASRDDLAERYLALELRAIKERTLGDARGVLERAREAGARERVPEVFASAAEQLERVEAFVERQRHADAELQERAAVARVYAKRAFELNRAARAVEAEDAEGLVLEQERRLEQLGDALGLPDRRDRALGERWEELESAATSQRGDRDFLVAQNQKLRDELTAARSEIEKLSGRNQSLARERDFNALFERARALFEPSEAEVYRQAGRLIIRLRSIDFPVGEATIPPSDYPLLGKVQRAIRTFGHPTVTIEGHTDSTGGAALNVRLSQQRADAVRDYLVANNVLPGFRIVAVGRAAEEPLASNDTAEGRALNRRIDVILDTREILFIAAGTSPR